jgi:hypothetical protein
MNIYYMRLDAWKLLRKMKDQARSLDIKKDDCSCRQDFAAGVIFGAHKMWELVEQHTRFKRGERYAE